MTLRTVRIALCLLFVLGAAGTAVAQADRSELGSFFTHDRPGADEGPTTVEIGVFVVNVRQLLAQLVRGLHVEAAVVREEHARCAAELLAQRLDFGFFLFSSQHDSS